jgi:rRNA-processing protein EBP2
MSPKNKRVKVDHDCSSAAIEPVVTKTEEKEPEWLLLEDLEEEDIDDEFGDMIIQQKLLVNNEVFCLQKSLL